VRGKFERDDETPSAWSVAGESRRST
jgi:hypothetical protein